MTSAVGRPSGRSFCSCDGGAVEAVEALVDRVLEDLAAADALVDDGRRHLALAEAGDAHRLGDVLVRVVDAGLQLIRRDRDGELDARGAELLDRGLHHWGSPEWCWRCGMLGVVSGRQDLNLRPPAPKAGALPS